MNARNGCFSVAGAGGVPLDVGALPPAETGAPVLLIVHGIASHRGWYAPLAEALRAEGVGVYLPDRRGSGTSGGERGHTPRWTALVEDLELVAAEVRRRHPSSPIHLLGISLGGVIATAAALRDPTGFRSLSLLAPGFASRIRVPFWRRLRVLRRSWTAPTKLYDLPFGVEALTPRQDWQRALGADPLRTSRVSARFLVEMFKMQRFGLRGLARIGIPTQLLLAGDDAIIDNEAILDALARAPAPRVRVELWEGAPHLLPSARPRGELLCRILAWIRGEAPAPGGPPVVSARWVGSEGELPAPPPVG